METQTFIAISIDGLSMLLHKYEAKEGWQVRQIVFVPSPNAGNIANNARFVVVFERPLNWED